MAFVIRSFSHKHVCKFDDLSTVIISRPIVTLLKFTSEAIGMM